MSLFRHIADDTSKDILLLAIGCDAPAQKIINPTAKVILCHRLRQHNPLVSAGSRSRASLQPLIAKKAQAARAGKIGPFNGHLAPAPRHRQCAEGADGRLPFHRRALGCEGFRQRSGAYSYLTALIAKVYIHRHTHDALMMWMVAVIAPLIQHIAEQEKACSDADAEAGQIDEGKERVLAEAAQPDSEIRTNHAFSGLGMNQSKYNDLLASTKGVVSLEIQVLSGF